jgi:hypothetical protein
MNRIISFILSFLLLLQSCKQQEQTQDLVDQNKLDKADPLSEKIRQLLIGSQHQLDKDLVYIPRLIFNDFMKEMSMQLGPLPSYRLPSCPTSSTTDDTSAIAFARGNEVFSTCYSTPVGEELDHLMMHPLDCEMCLWMSEVNRMKDYLHDPIDFVEQADSYWLYRDSSLDLYMSIASSLGSIEDRRRDLSICLFAPYEELNPQIIRYLALTFSPKLLQIFLMTGNSQSIYRYPKYRLAFHQYSNVFGEEMNVKIDVHDWPFLRASAKKKKQRTSYRPEAQSIEQPCSVVYMVGDMVSPRDLIQFLLDNEKLDLRYSQVLRQRSKSFKEEQAISSLKHLSVLIMRDRPYHSSKYQRDQEIQDVHSNDFSIFWQLINHHTNTIFNPKSLNCLPVTTMGRKGRENETVTKDKLHTCSNQSYRNYVSFQGRRYELWTGKAIIHSDKSIGVIEAEATSENVLKFSVPSADSIINNKAYGGLFRTHKKQLTRRLARRLSHPPPKEIIFITYDVTMFIENALGLQEVLERRLGLERVEVMGPFNYTRYRELLEEMNCFDQFTEHPENTHFLNRNMFSSFPCPRLIQIAIAPHRPTILTRNYIVFHTENSWDSFLDLSDRVDHNVNISRDFNATSYQTVLSNSLAILIYSDHNRELMSGNQAIPSEMLQTRVFTIPMYTKPVYFKAFVHGNQEVPQVVYREQLLYPTMALTRSTASWESPKAWFPSNRIVGEEKIFDYTLLFSNSKRRNAYFSHVEGRFEQDELRIFQTNDACIDGYDIWTKEFLITTSNVAMNFHQFNDSILETHRINHMLSLGMPIVSERSFVDPQLDSQYENAIIFADNWDDLYDKLIYLAKNETARRELSLKALEKYKEIMQDDHALRRAMALVLERPF